PLRQRDLLVGGQQIDGADRAEIETERVETRLDGQVELLLAALPVRALLSPLVLLVGRDTVRGDHVDPLLHQMAVKLRDLLLGHPHLFEGRRDLLECQIPPFRPLRNQSTQLFALPEGMIVGRNGLANRRHLLSFLPAPSRTAWPRPYTRTGLKRAASI